MTKYTPGPWLADHMRAGTGCFKVFMDKYGFKTIPTNKANAHLIAAAPDLFKALNDLILESFESDIMGYLPEDSMAFKVLGERLEAAEKAIAKARGES